MNRIITILVTIFILLLLYIWISHVWGTDKSRHPQQIVDATETPMSDDFTADADSASSGSGTQPVQDSVGNDEYATERKTEVSEEVKSEPVKSAPVEEKKMVESKPVNVKPEPAAKKVTTAPATPAAKPATTSSKPASTTVSSTSSTGGKHLVIAGNFTQEANAQQRVKELKKAGYPDAEVINFDLSEYYTVCVGRFSDVNEARRLVKKLKDYHKIDAYVRIGS